MIIISCGPMDEYLCCCHKMCSSFLRVNTKMKKNHNMQVLHCCRTPSAHICSEFKQIILALLYPHFRVHSLAFSSMESPKPPEPRTRRACKAKAEAKKLEEQRILDEFPYVLMVGRNEEIRQRKVDKVNDERRRELDAVERGEAIIKQEVVDEEEREQELNNNIQVQSNEVGAGEGDIDVKEEVVEGEEEVEANLNGNRGE